MLQYIVGIKDLLPITPEIILLVWSMAILLAMVFLKEHYRFRNLPFYLALAGIVLAGIAYYQQVRWLFSQPQPAGFHPVLNQMYSADGMNLFFKGFILAAGLLTLFISKRFLEEEKATRTEYFALLLASMTAMMFMAGAMDLITIYISLEFMAISIYILVGYLSYQSRSTEASLKYFILGAFSSGILLFGMSLIYGLTGSTNLETLHAAILQGYPANEKLLVLAMIMFLAGLGFKVAAVPFHMWCPDAYEGAPTPITAFMSVAPKAAAFAIFIRLFMLLFNPLEIQYVSLIGLLSLLTMTLGNILAVRQANIKRLLAYSSISHAGYLLMGLMVRETIGLQAIGVYLVCYLFMNIGAFAVVAVMRRRGILGEDLEDFSGLIHRQPVIAIVMSIFLLSLAGIPPTAGFIAKYWVFSVVIKGYLETGSRILLWVAIAGALNAVVALYYYFRIVRRMMMGEERDIAPLALGVPAGLVLAITTLATLAIGVYPDPVIRFAQWIQLAFVNFY